MGVLSASLLKLIHRPATGRTLLVVVAAVAATLVMIATTSGGARASALWFPDAYAELAAMLSAYFGLAAAAYAGMVAASEWSWGGFRVAVARGEPRMTYAFATQFTVAIVILGGWLLVFAAGVVLVVLVGAIEGAGGDPPDSMVLSSAPAIVASGGWMVVMQASIGFAVAFATRSQIAGVSAVVALYVAEESVGRLLPVDLAQLAPIAAGRELINRVVASGTIDALVVPFAAVGVYVVASVALVALVARRSEIA